MVPLKLCILSSEINPYAKTGGLADVVGALIRELAHRTHEVHAFMPLYAAVGRTYPNLQPVLGLQHARIKIGATDYPFAVRTATYPDTTAAVYFIDCPQLFDRPSFYTTDADEHRRFLLFTRAAIESCRR